MSDREQLLRFAGRALSEARVGQIGDWDGGDLEETALACGLLAAHEVTEPCDPEACRCAEYGLPTTCYRLTELGHEAVRAVSRGPTPPETT